jgi:hypothetical protein
MEEKIHVSTGTPLVTPSRITGMGAISGVALKMLYGAQQSKTALRRSMYGPGFRHVVRDCLILLGASYVPDVRQILISWPNSVPVNDLENAQVAEIKSRLGFSQTTLIRDLGGNPDQEAELKAAEIDQADAMGTALVEQLGAIGAPGAFDPADATVTDPDSDDLQGASQ